jgi:uncharacterized protein
MPSENERHLKMELYRFMSHHKVMTLAYQDMDGPGACAVWFAIAPDLKCYFLSAKKTRHGAAMQHGASMAFTVQKDDQDWRLIQGVQGRGYCQPLAPEQRESAWQTYSARFPFVIQTFGSVATALAHVTMWSITPYWLRLIDNTKGFGHKEELVSEKEVS